MRPRACNRRIRACRKRRVGKKIVARIFRTSKIWQKCERGARNRFARAESFTVAMSAARPGQTIALNAYGLWQVAAVTRWHGKKRCRQCGADQVFFPMPDHPHRGLWCWGSGPGYCAGCDPDE